MSTDEHWAVLEPLTEAGQPKGKTPPHDFRRTLPAGIKPPLLMACRC